MNILTCHIHKNNGSFEFVIEKQRNHTKYFLNSRIHFHFITCIHHLRNLQALQAENFAAALTACNGNAACIADKAAIMASSSSLTAAEIKAAEISVSPN